MKKRIYIAILMTAATFIIWLFSVLLYCLYYPDSNAEDVPNYFNYPPAFLMLGWALFGIWWSIKNFSIVKDEINKFINQ